MSFVGEIHREVLPNGLQVIVAEDHAAPEVALHLLLPTGSAADPAGRAGLAHLVEHLAFAGSEHAPDYDGMLARVGGESGAWTEADATAFWVRVPAGALDLALFLESDRMGWLTFDERAVATQRAVIAREAAETDWERRRRLATLLWPPGHPYRNTVFGPPEQLGISIREARERLSPRGASLAVVGDFDADAALERVRAWFADVSDVSSGVSDVSRETPDTSVVVSEGRVAWTTVPLTHADRPALDLLAQVLRARLDTDVQAWSGRLGGTFEVEVPDGRSARWVQREVQRAPTEEELRRARGVLRVAELETLETPVGKAAALNLCAARTGEPDCLPKDWAARERVDPAEVRRVAARWLRQEWRRSPPNRAL